ADDPGRIGNARMHQPFLADREARALLAQAVLQRYLDVDEVHLVGRIRTDHRDRLHRHTGRAAIDDETSDAAAGALLASARENEAPVGPAGRGDPHLGAVDDVAVAFAHGARANRARRVGTARGFGNGHETLRALADARLAVP